MRRRSPIWNRSAYEPRSDDRPAPHRGFACPVRYAGRLYRGGQGRQLPHAGRLDGGAGRRIRLPQRRDRARQDPLCRPARRRYIRRPRPAAGRRSRDAGDPRRPDFDHLSGADEFAVAGAHDRRPGRRGVAPAPDPDRGGGERADHRHAAPGRLSRSGAGLAQLSFRAVRGPAAAGDDRDGAGVPAGAVDRRRADHRARRDDSSADPEVDRRIAARARHGRAADHPRSRRRR